ncbi:MAG: M81 family metallopeptidase [Planctomycetaceae bacterium]
MSRRVLIAGLFHETHTFLTERTPWSAFTVRRGNEFFTASGDGSPLAGVLDIADERGWEVIPTIDARATPSGTVEDQVFEQFWSELRATAEPALQQGLDGIYLVLHGAMVTETIRDPEGELVRRLRGLPGGNEVPIGGVLDLHGNISREFSETTQAFVAYRKNPHTDACEAARDGARLLDRVMNSDRWPVTLHAAPGIVWPPTGVSTQDDPMRFLEELAREIERQQPDIAAINVFASYSFADTPDTGVSFMAVTFGDPNHARCALQSLCDEAIHRREQGNVVPPSLDSLLATIQAEVARGETPVIVVEPSDNIGGGAPGDLTHVFRALVANGISNSAVVINDPLAVEEIRSHPIGWCGPLTFGGRSDPRFDAPVTCDVELLTVSDGQFTLEDRHSHLASMCGVQIDMGPCAVVRHEGIRVLLTSHKTPPFDLGQLRSQGIIPESLSVIGVKAAVAHRQAYDPIAKHSHTVNTLGPCTSDLCSLPLEQVRRPIFPLDRR